MKTKFNHRLIIAALATFLFITLASHAMATQTLASHTMATQTMASHAMAIQASDRVHISGVLQCDMDSEAHAFGTIALFSAADTSLVSGTISDAEGRFSLSIPSDNNNAPHFNNAAYFLRITYVGYEALDIELEAGMETAYDLGFVCLRRVLHEMDEFVFVGERISAADGRTKTTYFLNQKLYDASFSGGDVLRHIPGIQVDFMQNISMAGSQAVAIMVNGRERDAAFVRQLDARQIDRVEVVHNPGSRYEAGISGVINIILKEPESGLRTFVNAEIPTASAEVYIFPNYGIEYTKGRVNLTTSYSGEVSRMVLSESDLRNFRSDGSAVTLNTSMDLRQDHWSHRFNVGMDFLVNERTRFNVYGFINPYSRENSGTVILQVSTFDSGEGLQNTAGLAFEYAPGSAFPEPSGNQPEAIHWTASKQDNDKNLLSYGSVYLEHRLRPGTVFTMDAGYYDLQASNTTKYVPVNPDLGIHKANGATGLPVDGFVNTRKPNQQTLYAKADFSAPVSGNLGFEAGSRGNLRKMQDLASDGFSYREQLLAAYAALNYSNGKLNAQAGLRAEYSGTELAAGSRSELAVILPYFTAGVKPATNQNLQITFRQSLRRPNIHELSPTLTMDNPWSVESGNPLLQAEKRSVLTAGHSIMAGNTFIASQLFYQHFDGAINQVSFINENGQFDTRVHNLGNIAQYGMQVSGSLNFHPALAINPYVRVFQVDARPNGLAGDLGIFAIRKVSYETGLSVVARLGERLTASFASQYYSPRTDLQQVTFSNMLYFVSVEKSFQSKWRVGLTSALPLQRSFTYNGTRVDGPGLNRHAEGNIMLSAVPVWIRLSYQFNSGRRVNTIKREIENFEGKPKIGF